MLKKLGVLEDVEKICIIKYGAEMVSHCFGRSQIFYFAKALDESQPYAFEVKRSEFEVILLENAMFRMSRTRIIDEELIEKTKGPIVVGGLQNAGGSELSAGTA